MNQAPTRIPAVIATAYQLSLWWAGGPTTVNGSLRDVEIRRQGKVIGTLDLYKYELGGGNADDIRLGFWRCAVYTGQAFERLRFRVRFELTAPLRAKTGRNPARCDSIHRWS